MHVGMTLIVPRLLILLWRFTMTEIINVSEKAARFIKAKPGSFFVMPKQDDVPFDTCAKFGVKLFVTPMKDQPFKVVKRV